MLGQLFQARAYYQQAKDGAKDPGELISGALLGGVMGYIVGSAIVVGLILLLLGFLGYSAMLGGPFGLARFFLYFLGVPALFLYVPLFSVIAKLKGKVKSGINKQAKKNFDFDVTP